MYLHTNIVSIFPYRLNPVERIGNKKNGIMDIKKHKYDLFLYDFSFSSCAVLVQIWPTFPVVVVEQFFNCVNVWDKKKIRLAFYIKILNQTHEL